MNCPRDKCASVNTIVLRTLHPMHERLPKIYKGHNLVRRTYRCEDCKLVFNSIEIAEEEYDDLKRPVRLQAAYGRI